MMKNQLTTVIAPFQLMAQTIAKAIGANEEHTGYYLGNGYAVTWTNGEIIEATFKPSQKFVMSSYQDMRQMYAHHFEFKMRNINAIVGWEKSKQDAAQLDTIKALWTKSEVIVNAMTPDFDGELAFLNLYWFLRQPKTVRRAWLPTLTKMPIVKAVEKGVRNPEEHEKWLGEELVNHFLACDKEANCPNESCDEAEPVEVKVEEVKHTPLFNIATLAEAAEEELKMDADKVFRLATTLYAKKLISYPFTLQNTVPGGVKKRMRRNMRLLRHNSKWGRLAEKVVGVSNRNAFANGECVFNGYGIVTTGLHPTDLTRDEEKLYNLIVKRVIDAFGVFSNPSKKKARKS